MLPRERLERLARPCSVLVVDDDPDCREVLWAFLGLRGFTVELAANGKDALEVLRGNTSGRPCVILLDLLMPVMGGREFRQEQARDPSLVDIPVVIISAEEVSKGEYRSVDANEYLKKPLDFDQLGALVERYSH
jgi:CheY-like chemotaxis protein